MANDQRLIRTDGMRLRHTPSFDGFRGFGVLIVVFYHSNLLPFLGGAPIVIDWFFVASGFLITMILLDEREATGANSLRRFYERRVLRLFPAMYTMILAFTVLMIVVTVLSSEIRSKLGNWWIDALAAAGYSYYLVAAIIPNKVTGAIGHTWSLSLEEQFYFIWPLVLIFALNKARRRSDRSLIIGMVVFMVAMWGIRFGLHYIVEVRPPGEAVGAVRYRDMDSPGLAGTLYRIAGVRPDMIVYGCLLAFLYKALPTPLPDRWRRMSAVLGFIGFVTMFGYLATGNRLPGFRFLGRGVFDLIGGPAYQVALLMLGPFILEIYLHKDGMLARMFSFKPLRWLGVRSYGIYLWHVLPVLIIFAAVPNTYGVRRLAVGLVAGLVGIGGGVLSFKFIERPFLHIKETKFRRTYGHGAKAATDVGAADR